MTNKQNLIHVQGGLPGENSMVRTKEKGGKREEIEQWTPDMASNCCVIPSLRSSRFCISLDDSGRKEAKQKNDAGENLSGYSQTNGGKEIRLHRERATIKAGVLDRKKKRRKRAP